MVPFSGSPLLSLFLWLFLSFLFVVVTFLLFLRWPFSPCERTHLDFYTIVTSLPSVGLYLQDPILNPVTILCVVRDCCDIHQHGSTKIHLKNIAHGSGASVWHTHTHAHIRNKVVTKWQPGPTGTDGGVVTPTKKNTEKPAEAGCAIRSC